jgi:hypothetical protein
LLPALLKDIGAKVEGGTALDYSLAKGILDQGDSLLIVAHSQGNLYSNAVAKKLYINYPASFLDTHFSLVGAGVPSDKMIGLGGASGPNYVTNFYDSVIDALRVSSAALGLLQPLPANSRGLATGSSVNFSTEALQHAFLEVYFNENIATGKQLVSLITTQFSTLSTPSAQSASSTIAYSVQATLTFPNNVLKYLSDFGVAPSLSLNYAYDSGTYLPGKLNPTFLKQTLTYKSDYSYTFNADVTCAVADRASIGLEMPMLLLLSYSYDLGPPAVSNVTLTAPAKGVRQSYPSNLAITQEGLMFVGGVDVPPPYRHVFFPFATETIIPGKPGVLITLPAESTPIK